MKPTAEQIKEANQYLGKLIHDGVLDADGVSQLDNIERFVMAKDMKARLNGKA